MSKTCAYGFVKRGIQLVDDHCKKEDSLAVTYTLCTLKCSAVFLLAAGIHGSHGRLRAKKNSPVTANLTLLEGINEPEEFVSRTLAKSLQF